MTGFDVLTSHDMRELVNDIEFSDWKFQICVDNGIPFLRVAFQEEDVSSGRMAEVHGRKWRLSYHMTRSEVVQTALKAVLTAMEHEVRETFMWRGQRIFGPHLDIDVLHAIAENVDVRAPLDGTSRQGVTILSND